MPEIPVTALHNYLAKINRLDWLSYSEVAAGPQNDPTWTIECKINGTVRGTGIAKKKNAAKEAAAKEALQALRSGML
ncbi:hypothetical protein D9611_005499 [Ephemerocybe angulata]|uniref:Uncharacterized protein n=2 Tax=Ephemerocybe angulata TaxID=980116 RepID=A0A8H6HW62_9AGAR|nr:hypothetical protein D9611_005499 [Tulosesus angulatus]KAF6754299.1 hypothetical protein DFP72DRAFT_899903 [Tulosesus angulatus]